MRTLILVLMTTFLGIIVSGCESHLVGKRSKTEAIKVKKVWPQPPLKPRIQFVGSFWRLEDLGVRPSFWERAVKFLSGGSDERFVRPTGVAVDGNHIYVADPGAQALWVIDIETKRFLQVRMGDGGQSLVSPVAVTIGRNHQVYLADSFLAKIFVFSPAGEPKGTIPSKNLVRPTGMAYDEIRDRLYVADSADHRIWIFGEDDRSIATIGRRGTGNGEFNFPTHLTVNREGVLYVTDSLGFRVQFFSSEGKFQGQFGRHGDTAGDFARPKGIALDSEGHIYVVEALFDSVQIFDRHGRFLLSFGERGTAGGQFWLPAGIFITSQDRIYVADAFNQRIQIFQYLRGG